MSGADASRRRQARAVIWFERMRAGALTEYQQRHWNLWYSNLENQRAFAAIVLLWKSMEQLPRSEGSHRRALPRGQGQGVRHLFTPPIETTASSDARMTRDGHRRSFAAPIVATIVACWAAVVTFQQIRQAVIDPPDDATNRQAASSAVPPKQNAVHINGVGSSQREHETQDQVDSIVSQARPDVSRDQPPTDATSVPDVEDLPALVLMPPIRKVVPSTPEGLSRELLSDGSVVMQSPDALVKYEFTAERRWVRLVKGEAIFQVARDWVRPFEVTAASVKVLAVGTRFSVRVQPDRITVTVVEGKVVVAWAGRRAGRAVAVRANEQIVIDEEAGRQAVNRVDAMRKPAWADGKVVFKSEPIQTAIAEFNRRSSAGLQMTGGMPAELTITGTFDLDDPERFVEFVNSAVREFRRRDAATDR